MISINNNDNITHFKSYNAFGKKTKLESKLTKNKHTYPQGSIPVTKQSVITAQSQIQAISRMTGTIELDNLINRVGSYGYSN